ncbi:MAG: hypothetical protein H0X42_14275, partial [Solirubrobacterales bacterium]|nr:hypothetical protein [Solirubrobacterales bacterium]
MTNRRRHPTRPLASRIALAALALAIVWQASPAPAGAAARELRFRGETVAV